MSSLAFTTRTANDAEVFDSQAAAVGRVGFLVATGNDYNVHLGASGTYVFSPADQGQGTTPRHPLRFRDRPEIRVDSVRLIDTGTSTPSMPASMASNSARTGRASIYRASTSGSTSRGARRATLPDPDFTGYYLQGSWILTGESRRYNAVTGSFQNPRPMVPFSGDGGFGALELAARYSRMDLNFKEGLEGAAASPGSVRGGDQQVWTLGVNWFPNPNIKVMMNYLLIDVDRLNPAGPGIRSPSGRRRTRRPMASRSARIWTCSRCERSSASSGYSTAGSLPCRRDTSARRNTRLKRSWQAADTCSSSVELTRSTDTAVSARMVAVRRAPRT